MPLGHATPQPIASLLPVPERRGISSGWLEHPPSWLVKWQVISSIPEVSLSTDKKKMEEQRPREPTDKLMPGSEFDRKKLKWERATAGAIAGFATVVSLHPLDVVRTRFQVNDGRVSHLPLYKNTVHAIYTIARMEGFRGVYAGFFPAVLGSTVSWSLYFFFYGIAKNRHSKGGEKKLTPGLHLLSAAEAGALVSVFTNPIWVVKTRLQLQNPLHQIRPYSGFNDALRTIVKEEGWRALYRGMGPSLFLVSHAAIQFTVYEELRQIVFRIKSKRKMNATKRDKILFFNNQQKMLCQLPRIPLTTLCWVVVLNLLPCFSHILIRLFEHDYSNGQVWMESISTTIAGTFLRILSGLRVSVDSTGD